MVYLIIYTTLLVMELIVAATCFSLRRVLPVSVWVPGTLAFLAGAAWFATTLWLGWDADLPQLVVRANMVCIPAVHVLLLFSAACSVRVHQKRRSV